MITDSERKRIESSIRLLYTNDSHKDPYWTWDDSRPFIVITKVPSKGYQDSYKRLDRGDRRRVDYLVGSIKSGFLFKDDADESNTHGNKDHSRPGKGYVAWTKDISRGGDNKRLTYFVYKPIVNDDGVIVILVGLRGCEGHTFNVMKPNSRGNFYKKTYTESDDPLRTLSEWESDL
jgi:hypothetical protein